MGRLRYGWALGVVAPWCLGIGFSMSMSADAGQDLSFGATIAPLSQRAMQPPQDLVPSQAVLGAFGLTRTEPRALVQEARLVLGTAKDFAELPDEIEPRKTLKHNVGAQQLPNIDRTHKGNPFIGLRPSFDTQLRRRGGAAAIQAHDLLFLHDENSPSGAFSAAEGDFAGPNSVETFEPWPDGEMPTTAHSNAVSSPRQGGSVMTMRPAAINERLIQGATPAVARAAALASMTPAPADSLPIEVVALQRLPKSASVSQAANFSKHPGERPNYAALIDQEQAAREKKCLAEAIYFEARSEPEEGQAAVAQVVLNRVSSGLYPTTICGVVYQNRQHYHACQFSFACEGRSLRITEQDAWSTAVRIANEVTEGKTYLADVGASTHYHANYVRPGWSRRLEKMDVIGHHVFYKLRPGQT
jgi:spore germination cell wall hydrolase CwlJ-like protein